MGQADTCGMARQANYLVTTSSDKRLLGVHNSGHIDSSLPKRLKKSANCNHGAALYLYISKK